MAEDKKAPMDTETILMALDQISQTIDVMTSVVGRLKHYMQEQQELKSTETAEQKTETASSQTVH
ncbi:hypothetical protein N9284_03055 [Halieaceae bacterium]|jgi:hypothetical protein|nr:hypothetical protein [Halieaceae bacterium]